MSNTGDNMYLIVANHDREEKAVEKMESEGSAKRAMELVALQRDKGRKIESSIHQATNMEAAVKEAERQYPHYHRLGTVGDVLKTLESDPK